MGPHAKIDPRYKFEPSEGVNLCQYLAVVGREAHHLAGLSTVQSKQVTVGFSDLNSTFDGFRARTIDVIDKEKRDAARYFV